MPSPSSAPAPRRSNKSAISIDWNLLWRRLLARIGQLFTSLRHKAGRTEYIPPAWMQRFRLSWFRLGLMALAVFIFTQKQVDVTLSVGKEGLAIGESSGRHSAAKGGEQAASSTSAASISAMPVGSQRPGTAATAKPAWNVNSLDAARVRAYVNRFEKVAQGEEQKFNIPAPAAMALAILNSDAGQSTSAKSDNNHFGTITSGRYYENAWMNWRAHSKLVNKRFPELANNAVNYQQWVAALAKTSYSSDRELANKLMDIVKRFNLDRL